MDKKKAVKKEKVSVPANKILRDYFESQNTGWRFVKYMKGGGQNSVLQICRNNNEYGVFRKLLLSSAEKEKAEDIARFKREITILTDSATQHPNILKPIQYSSKDPDYWYISPLGESFKDHWSEFRKKNNANQQFHTALNYIMQLLEGLKLFHEKGVVHRDIKPDNIILLVGKPVLIDFALAYSNDAVHVTPKGQFVGNVGFSADVAHVDGEMKLPWLDVFQLGQLLIWMLCKKPLKGWYRPLAWDWVQYSEDFSKENINVIYAITARISNFAVSPKNATELIDLINNIYLNKSNTSANVAVFDITPILKSQQAQRSALITRKEKDISLFKAILPQLREVDRQITLGIHRMTHEFSEKSKFPYDFIPKAPETGRKLDDLLTSLPFNEQERVVVPGPQFFFSEPPNPCIEMVYSFVRANSKSWPHVIQSMPLIEFYLKYKEPFQPTTFMALTIDNTGNLVEVDLNGFVLSDTIIKIDPFVEKIAKWLYDEKTWEIIPPI